jgi:hypothetical protein
MDSLPAGGAEFDAQPVRPAMMTYAANALIFIITSR